MIFNVVELFGRGETGHLLSLYLMPAFFATSFALYKFNKYPSKVGRIDAFHYKDMQLASAYSMWHYYIAEAVNIVKISRWKISFAVAEH